MGKNKKLKKSIASLDRQASEHSSKIENELRKEHPDRGLINAWTKEIKAAEDQSAKFRRRLKKGKS